MTDQTETAKPKAKRPPKGPDVPELERLLAIAAQYSEAQLGALMHRLETEEGMKITVKGDVQHVALARLKTQSTAGRENAVRAWLAKARRTVRGFA